MNLQLNFTMKTYINWIKKNNDAITKPERLPVSGEVLFET